MRTMTDGAGTRPAPGPRGRRRRHPAQGARIVAAGASAAAVLGITAAFGFARDAAAPPATRDPGVVTTTTPPDTPPVPWYLRPATPAPFVPNGPPHATTHGSR
jgi:hypothetical protein